MNPRRRNRLDDARSRADDRAVQHGGWVTAAGNRSVWAFMVGTTCAAQWDAVFGRFWRGDGHTRWQNAAWRFPGVFDPETATRLGVTAIIQHRRGDDGTKT